MTWAESEMLSNAILFHPESIREPDSWIGHIPFANWLIQRTRPETFVGLGTHAGNSYFAFCQSADELGLSMKLYAVDTWRGDEHSGFYDDSVFALVTKENQKYLTNSSLIRSKFSEAVDNFQDGSIDILHIDGLHTYEAVKHDFNTWLPKLAPGAHVLFHDVNVRIGTFGVFRLWAELQERFPTIEFSHSNGLGVLELPGNAKSAFITDLSEEEKSAMILLFSRLGDSVTRRFRLQQTEKEAHQLRHEIFEIRNSNLWRLTSFLRKR